MRIRLDEAIELFNRRREILNVSEGKPQKEGCINHLDIGERYLYPDSSYSSMVMMVNKLRAGKVRRILPEVIILISDVTNVDPNFILGVPSVFDAEYEEYFSETKTK